MKQDFNKNEELENAPKLRALQGNEPFKAPDNYFENLSSSVQDKISAQHSQIANIPFYKKPALIIAVLSVFLLSFAVYFNIREQKTQIQFAFSYDDVIESGYYTEIDENLLADNLNTDYTISKDDSAIEDYLISNSDESFLTEQP